MNETEILALVRSLINGNIRVDRNLAMEGVIIHISVPSVGGRYVSTSIAISREILRDNQNLEPYLRAHVLAARREIERGLLQTAESVVGDRWDATQTPISRIIRQDYEAEWEQILGLNNHTFASPNVSPDPPLTLAQMSALLQSMGITEEEELVDIPEPEPVLPHSGYTPPPRSKSELIKEDPFK